MVAMAGPDHPALPALMVRPARQDVMEQTVHPAETARTASMVHKGQPVSAGHKENPVNRARWVMLVRLDRKVSLGEMRQHQRQ